MPIFYVPLLKAKGGEFAALKELDPVLRAQTFPIFDVTPIPWDFDNDEPAKTIDEHLAKLADNIFKAIGGLPCGLDFTWLDPGARMNGGVHPLTWVFGELRKKGVVALPVVGPGCDAQYLAAAAAEIAVDRRGCVVRVAGQARVFHPALATQLASVLAAVNLTEADADLLLDLQAVASGSEPGIALATAAVIGALPVGKWRSLFMGVAGFPPDLSGMGQGLFILPRTCLITWDALRCRGVLRLPIFGDYAVDDHDRSELDVSPKVLKGSTNLRYTVRADWLVLKGPNWKDNGFGPMKGLCAQLVADARFSGAAFSWGDNYIDACAKGTVSTGNGTTWRKVGVNHHVTFVMKQIASLHAASGASGRPLSGPGAEPLP